MINEQLLKNVIKRIEREVEIEGWDQNSWATLKGCGSRPSRAALRRKGLVPADYLFAEYYAMSDEVAASCGTSFCLAGHTVLEAGDKILFEVGTNEGYRCLTPEGEIVSIRDRAAELLGLSLDNYRQMEVFSPGLDDLDEFKRLIENRTKVDLS